MRTERWWSYWGCACTCQLPALLLLCMGHALYRGRRAECLLSPQLELGMLTTYPCVGLCLQLSMSPVLCGRDVHTLSSLMMALLRGAAQAKAGLVTAKTMQRQMGDLQSSPCREEVECPPSSCTEGTQKPWDLPSALKLCCAARPRGHHSSLRIFSCRTGTFGRADIGKTPCLSRNFTGLKEQPSRQWPWRWWEMVLEITTFILFYPTSLRIS